MSDFLRNLRSSHKKDGTDQRRNLDGHYYPQKERRQVIDRRLNHPENLESILSSIDDLLPQLMENTTAILTDLQKKQKADSLLTEAKIRHYETMTAFFENLNVFLCQDQVSEPGLKPRATSSYASGTHYTKDDILSIIQHMRQNGSTFAIIAQYLKDKGIPTFSGRGDWHAQTIHRLCK